MGNTIESIPVWLNLLLVDTVDWSFLPRIPTEAHPTQLSLRQPATGDAHLVGILQWRSLPGSLAKPLGNCAWLGNVTENALDFARWGWWDFERWVGRVELVMVLFQGLPVILSSGSAHGSIPWPDKEMNKMPWNSTYFYTLPYITFIKFSTFEQYELGWASLILIYIYV